MGGSSETVGREGGEGSVGCRRRGRRGNYVAAGAAIDSRLSTFCSEASRYGANYFFFPVDVTHRKDKKVLHAEKTGTLLFFLFALRQRGRKEIIKTAPSSARVGSGYPSAPGARFVCGCKEESGARGV